MFFGIGEAIACQAAVEAQRQAIIAYDRSKHGLPKNINGKYYYPVKETKPSFLVRTTARILKHARIFKLEDETRVLPSDR